jgi:hypothetical protein
MTDEIEIKISDLSRVELAPGDVVIYRHPLRISEAAAAAIRNNLSKAFPGHRIGILEDGAELAVVRPIPTTDPALADRLDAIVEELTADTANKGVAALRAILLLRNEAEDLRSSATTVAPDRSL